MNRPELIATLRRRKLLHLWLKRSLSFFTSTIPRLLKDVWRALVPPTFSFGLPRGAFSILEMLESPAEKIEGRIVLKHQGSPTVTEDSIMVRCNLRQHAEQPWPVFWCRQRNARLVGKSLVLRNPKGQLCSEAVYRQTCGIRSQMRSSR